MTSMRHETNAPGSDQRTSGLTAAARARTIVAATTSLQVGILNQTTSVQRHAVTTDGTILFVPDPAAPERIFAVARNLPSQTVHASAQDLAPVARADRVRGSVLLTGRLGLHDGDLPPGARERLVGPAGDPDAGPVLALRPTRVALTWRCEVSDGAPRAVDIPGEEYRSAQPDPLLTHESEWLSHLHKDHAEVVRALAAAAAGGLADDVVVHPLCLDRYGVVLRLLDDAGHRDVRLAFPRPVACGCEVHAAFTDLLVGTLPEGPVLDC